MPSPATTATEVTAATGAQAEAPYLGFRCGGHRLAVPVFQVREVVEPRPLTRVPDAPAWALGVMNLRGHVVPVVDLARRLGFEESVARRPCVLMAEVPLREVPSEIPSRDASSADDRPFGDDREEIILGLWVDGVDEVWPVDETAVEEPPSFGVPVHPEYLHGVVERREEAVLLLHLPRVLSTRELRQAVEAGGDEESSAAPSEEAPE